MSKLRVDTDSMQKLDTSLKEKISEAAELMIAMRDSVETLDSTWMGESHDKFAQSFEERKDAVKAKALTLEKFEEALGQAVQLYVELEEAVADAVGAI